MTAAQKIDALLKARIGEQASAIERIYFVKTDRVYSPKKTNPFRYFPGNAPVLVSAPHSVRHMRQKKIKPSDEFTGSMAYVLNTLTGCHSLAVARLYGGDPNFDDECIYKDTVREICLKNDIKVVVDLHGASREHGFDIDIGTTGGASLLGQGSYLNLLKEYLSEFGITAISENQFTMSGQNTITRFTSEVLNLPAMQLEISKKYRVPHQNPAEYCRIMAALMDFIVSLHQEQI